MVHIVSVVTLSSGVAISHALNSVSPGISTPLAAAAGDDVDVDADDVNLLQSSVSQKTAEDRAKTLNVAPIFDDHLTHDDVGFGSFTSEDYVHCVEGDFHDSETAHSLMRASPITSLYYTHEYQEGHTCASLGYTELFQEHDDCWQHFTRWIRPGVPAERANYGAANGGLWLDILDLYDRDHGYPLHTSREWTACGICTGNSVVRTEAWGSSFDCANATESEPRVIANMRLATTADGSAIPRGSITPNSDVVCFEGSMADMEMYLEHTLTTPLGSLFSDSVVSEQNCLERGFDMVRDLIDECWPASAKVFRAETEDEDLGAWIWAYQSAIQDYDSSDLSSGLWNTADWVACRACFPGGAVRGRGLWTTQHGGDSLPYTDTFCRAAQFPDSMP
jgi:hypothetical protein